MRRLTTLAIVAVSAAGPAGCAGEAPGTLSASQAALATTDTRSIEVPGTGRWFQFGQAANPTLPWPAFDLKSFSARIDYEAPAALVQMERIQVVEPNRARPTPVAQRVVQVVSGTHAWNMAAPAGAAPGTGPAPQAQPAAVEERVMEIWTTPHGFLKAAAANAASSQGVEGGSEITFTVGGKYRYVGRINARNEVERVQTFIDNPILGDTPVEFAYSDYRDFGGIMFPARIVRTQGGHPVLELSVASVTKNAPVDVPVPDQVRSFAPPPNTVTVEKLANGVYYLKGGSHHSVAIEQADHVVVVEAPQNEARSLAVIAKVKETVPAKPIRYIVNSHVHFDHSGGLRTYVAEGATVVTHEMNRPYLRTGLGGAADPQCRRAGQVAAAGHLRDLRREARAHRWPAFDRDSPARRQRAQRRVCDGLPARRADPHRGGRVGAARAQRASHRRRARSPSTCTRTSRS